MSMRTPIYSCHVITDIIATDHRCVITWAWLARGTRTVFESIRSDSERRPVSSTSLEPVLIMTVEEWNDSGCAWVEHEEEHKEEEEDDRGQGRPKVNLSKTFSGS